MPSKRWDDAPGCQQVLRLLIRTGMLGRPGCQVGAGLPSRGGVVKQTELSSTSQDKQAPEWPQQTAHHAHIQDVNRRNTYRTSPHRPRPQGTGCSRREAHMPPKRASAPAHATWRVVQKMWHLPASLKSGERRGQSVRPEGTAPGGSKIQREVGFIRSD